MTEAEKTMDIKTLAVGAYQANCYIATCLKTTGGRNHRSGRRGGPHRRAAVKMMGANVKMILATHGHGDHVMGARGLAGMLNVPIAMHEDDVSFFREIYADRQLRPGARYPEADIRFKDGDVFEVGELEFKVLHTPRGIPPAPAAFCAAIICLRATLCLWRGWGAPTWAA